MNLKNHKISNKELNDTENNTINCLDRLGYTSFAESFFVQADES